MLQPVPQCAVVRHAGSIVSNHGGNLHHHGDGVSVAQRQARTNTAALSLTILLTEKASRLDKMPFCSCGRESETQKLKNSHL